MTTNTLEESLQQLNQDNNLSNPADRHHFDYSSISLDPKTGLVRIYSRKGCDDGYYEKEESIEYLLPEKIILPTLESLFRDNTSSINCPALRTVIDWWKDSSYEFYETNSNDSTILGHLTGRISIANRILDLSELVFQPSPDHNPAYFIIDHYNSQKTREYAKAVEELRAAFLAQI